MIVVNRTQAESRENDIKVLIGFQLYTGKNTTHPRGIENPQKGNAKEEGINAKKKKKKKNGTVQTTQ